MSTFCDDMMFFCVQQNRERVMEVWTDMDELSFKPGLVIKSVNWR